MKVRTRGLANHNFAGFVIVILSFWFVCPRLTLLLLLLLRVFLTMLLAMAFGVFSSGAGPI